MRLFYVLLVAAVLAGSPNSSVATPIQVFFNGFVSGPQELRNNACSQFNDDGIGCKPGQVPNTFTVYDNFALATDSQVRALVWHQFETLPENYLFTRITFWSGVPDPIGNSGLLFLSDNIVANRIATPNNPPLGSGPEFSVINWVSGLSLDLTAGSYWLGIHNEWSVGGVSSWSQTSGTPQAFGGRYQSTRDDAVPLRFFPEEESSFAVLGVRATQVPEPGSFALLAFGLLMVVARRRHCPMLAKYSTLPTRLWSTTS
ncbi:MAG: PEP-CTERM sorting domain-containing protein [Pseudomonadales bacterium]